MKVLVKEPFILNLGIVDGLPKTVEYQAGSQDMPEDHFKHWWSARHNVQSLEAPPTIAAIPPPVTIAPVRNVQPMRKPDGK